MPTFTEYVQYDGIGLAELIRRREVSAAEVLETALARCDALNPILNAVIHRMDASARATVSSAALDGPFGGVPFLVKDLVQFVAGEPFRAGSRFLGDFVPDHDSELVRRFRSAGLVFIGKTNTPEFGLTPFTEPEVFGPTRNPWNPTRTTGGSSGGSAAAVAAGIVPVAGGGDGGGSIRIPASCCGVFGLKPTRGRTPMGPDYGQLWQGAAIDHALTRSVRDSAALLDHTAGPDPGAPYFPPPPERSFFEAARRDPASLRIAWTSRPLLGTTVHPDCVRALDEAVTLLQELGHHVTEEAPEIDGAGFTRAFLTMVCAETAADLKEASEILHRRATRADLEPATWALALLGRALRADELSNALRALGRTSRSMGAFFTRYDVLVTPVLAVPPFEIGALQPKPRERMMLELLGRAGSGRLFRLAGLLDELSAQVFAAIPYTPIFNATGQPAMSVPLHWSAAGLPIGIQLVGRYAEETTLFRLAGQLERARPWFNRLPPLARPPSAKVEVG